MSLFFLDHGSTLAMQELKVISYHTLLAFMGHLRIRTGVEKFTTSHVFIIKPL
jgi:hypothetical protein